MKSYGQFCPLAQATQLLCERWTFIVIRELIAGSSRFSEIQRGVPLMSPTLLSSRLKKLITAGVVELSGKQSDHVYLLTTAGKELQPLVELLGVWGHRWVPANLDVEALDAGLLMWDMRRSINPAIFPNHKITIQFEYPDAPLGARDWWLVSENGEVDLCLKDHGFDVDLLIQCSLSAMTAVWICQQSFNEAVKKRQIKVLGNDKLATKLQDWLCSSALSKLGSLPTAPTLKWQQA